MIFAKVLRRRVETVSSTAALRRAESPGLGGECAAESPALAYSLLATVLKIVLRLVPTN